MSILSELRQRFCGPLQTLVSDASSALDLIRPAQDPRFGDYQANCAMPLGSQLKRPPRQIAQQIVQNLQIEDICHPPEIAGPGFINLRLREEWLASLLAQACSDPRLGIPAASQPRTMVVDYSSPNVAKSMHVGHIRSTVIGDCIARMLRFVGHRVIADNHLGDWGTPFGMIIYGYRHFCDQQAYRQNSLAELGRIYRIVRQLVDYHETRSHLPDLERRLADVQADCRAIHDELAACDAPQRKKVEKRLHQMEQRRETAQQALEQARETLHAVEADSQLARWSSQYPDIGQAVLEETAKLHAGDPQNLALWREFVSLCRGEIQRIYDRLDIRFDVELGESFYRDRLDSVVNDFLEKGLARESDGAICVFLDGFESPMIIRKQDGAFLYATTDLATIRYRMETWQPDAILYVVDFRQADHFAKLFAAARLWGYKDVELQHIDFGTVLGAEGKPFKTRHGDAADLEQLLDAAVERAFAVVSENDDRKSGGAELGPDERRHIAHVVGHGAIKYADLSQNRSTDYVYQEEKMVALRGNTATYLQYSYARVQNIFQRGQIDPAALRSQPEERFQLQTPAERALALDLLRFGEALDESLLDYRPNVLAQYLYQLATRFSEFYEACPVLKAESVDLRISRLLLCDLVGRTLQLGLSLLGISTVERM